MSEQISLKPVDGVDVTILVDNTMDVLLPGNEVAHRAPIRSTTFESPPLLAEHGYSLLLTIHHEGRSESLLYDAGLGENTAVHNMDVLGVQMDDLRAIVLSHGHTDHHGGLKSVLKRVGKQNLPLVLHPDVWLDRKGTFGDGGELHLPPPSRADLEQEGVEIVERRDPSLLLDDMVLVTGQVERTTDFEKGVPTHLARSGEEWQPDPWVWDDQAIMINVKDKGLVVLSGCSHSGIVNVLRYGKHLTGIEQVHGVVGGFHLSGGFYEQVIPPTVDALAEMQPDVIVPGHCTGWKAIHAIAQRMPQAYVQTCVGTRLHFEHA
jgi:7,8-dihydropterin-6-yl-methyl-4-(beta-D-ribofuranosyl)aminobenzene 5'-phosphate synthase